LVPPFGRAPRVPVVQAPFSAARTLMLVAVSAPVLSALPRAVTHVPVATAFDVAVTVLLNVVLEEVVTVTEVVVAACPNPVDSTTKPLLVTEVTFPLVPPNPRTPPAPLPCPPPGAPLANGVGVGAPLGRVPLPPKPPPGPPVKPARTQDPLTAEVIETRPAVTFVAGVLVDGVGDAVVVGSSTVTHDPTLTSAAEPLTVSVNVVFPSYVTAVCVLVPCT